MVLDYHSFSHGLLSYPLRALGWQPFGWVGVDVFFVLSGFLVGGLLVKEWRVKGRIDSKRFLIRRGFKIWPQYYLFIFLALLTGHRTIRDLWGNLVNIQNYVGGIAHTWSLAVEEHAYLFILLCLVLAFWWKARMRTVFFTFLGLAFFVSLLRLYLSAKGKEVYFATHTRIDGILYGVTLAIVYHYAPELFRRVQHWTLLWLGCIAAVLAFFRWNAQFWWAPSLGIDFANLLGIALLMLLYKHHEGKTHTALYRGVAWIGLYSYGIYLWHVSMSEPLFALNRHIPASLLWLWVGGAPPIAGILVGIVTTKLVEIPALKLRDRWFPRRVDSAVGIPAELETAAPNMQNM